MIELHEGDCLKILPTLEAGSVDMVLADPPYGTTACSWDSVIDLPTMWKELKRVIKPNGAIALFASQPFTSALIMSNIENFKYCWTWDKTRGTGHLSAKYRPMQRTEDIVIFGYKTLNYFPQMQKRPKPRISKEHSRSEIWGGEQNISHEGKVITHWHPTTVLDFVWSPQVNLHPTQKPIDLLRYLIRTYTQEGDTVLDFTMGSGSTLVACIEEGRNGIGIERDAGYFEIAKKRIEQEQTKPRTMRMELA